VVQETPHLVGCGTGLDVSPGSGIGETDVCRYFRQQSGELVGACHQYLGVGLAGYGHSQPVHCHHVVGSEAVAVPGSEVEQSPGEAVPVVVVVEKYGGALVQEVHDVCEWGHQALSAFVAGYA
jgi:hypothetical protein